jgi:hypothetical protein
VKDECGMRIAERGVEIRIVGLPFRNPQSAFRVSRSFLPVIVLQRFGAHQPALRRTEAPFPAVWKIV